MAAIGVSSLRRRAAIAAPRAGAPAGPLLAMRPLMRKLTLLLGVLALAACDGATGNDFHGAETEEGLGAPG